MKGRLAVIAWMLALAVGAAQAPSRAFVVVFDDEHLSSGSLKRLQAAATSLFADEFRPGDLGGVVIDGRLVSDRLLSDRDELVKAVQRAHPRRVSASDLESSTQVVGGVEQSSRLAEIATLDAARAAMLQKVSTLETLVGNLARIDGPKAVVVMSEGFGGDATSPRVREVIAAAARAGVRFHVLDESGSDRDAASTLARETGGSIARRAAAFGPSIATIARATGGGRPASGAEAAGNASPAAGSPAAAGGAIASLVAPAPSSVTSGVVVAEPSADPNLLRVRPLVESHVMDLAGGDWSDAAARAGWEAYQRGDLESARAALSPIAVRPIAPSWVEYVLGQADYGLGEFRGAAAAWEKVRARQPQFQPVYLDLADDYVKLNERKQAIDVLREGRRRWPRDGDVLNAYGVIVGGGGDIEEAIKSFNEAIALAPRETISYLNLAKVLEIRYFKRRRDLALLRSVDGDDSGDDQVRVAD